MIKQIFYTFLCMGIFMGSQSFPDENIVSISLTDDGTFPNNEKLPLVKLVSAVALPEQNPAAVIEELFQKNNWRGSWRNGIYSFHHYHSTAHEALGCYGGSAQVQFGGPEGEIVDFNAGDVVIIPAGVAHKKINSTSDFAVVGAYPDGQTWDMNYGKEGERPHADDNIAQVALPKRDPVFGADGPLIKLWNE